MGDSSSDSRSSGLDNSKDRSESNRTESAASLELVNRIIKIIF